MGDVVVSNDACTGPARGRIVFEAKASRLSKPKAVEELDRARTERNADYAVLVVPDEERIPAKMHQLREYGGDKLVVCFDPEDGSTLVARGRLQAGPRPRADGARRGRRASTPPRSARRSSAPTGAMGDVLRVKQQLTGATTSISKGAEILDAMAVAVRAQLMHVELLLARERAGDDDDDAPPAEPRGRADARSRRSAPRRPSREPYAGTAAAPRPGPARLLGAHAARAPGVAQP